MNVMEIIHQEKLEKLKIGVLVKIGNVHLEELNYGQLNHWLIHKLLKKIYITMDQLAQDLKFMRILEDIMVVFMKVIVVKLLEDMLLKLLDGVNLIKDKNIGLFKILGDQIGVKKDSLELLLKIQTLILVLCQFYHGYDKKFIIGKFYTK